MSLLHGRYQLLEKLAQHDSVTTWRARDGDSGPTLAIKILDVGSVASAQEVDLFQRQGTVLGALSHPRIPSVVSAFESTLDGRVVQVLVQTWVNGTSLEVPRPRMPSVVVALGIQAASILEHLHALVPPVLHRDVKPQNLLVDGLGNVHLVDFGSVASPASRNTVVGTYGYMPPEQYAGHATPASDVYALGVTLLFLFTGKHPWDQPAPPQEVARGLENVAPPLRDGLVAMLDPDARRRPRDGHAARVALEGAQRAPSQSTRPAGLAWRALAGVAAFAVTGAGAAFLLRTPGASIPVPTPAVVQPHPQPTAVPTHPVPPTPPPAEPSPFIRAWLGQAQRCFLRAVPRMLQSRDRYASWVDVAAGPTCHERIIYGLYAAYDDAIALCADAAAAAAVDGRMSAFRLQELSARVAEGIPLLRKAERYYDDRTYEDDGCAAGRAMHAPLMRMWDALAALVPPVEDALLAADVSVLERAARPPLDGALLSLVSLARLSPRFGPAAVDPALAVEARRVLAQLDALEGQGGPDASTLAGLQQRVRALVKRLRDQASKPAPQGYDPLGVRVTVHDAVVDLHTFRR